MQCKVKFDHIKVSTPFVVSVVYEGIKELVLVNHGVRQLHKYPRLVCQKSLLLERTLKF